MDDTPSAPRLRPTVCTNRPLDVTGPCLDALAAAGLGPDSVVVLSALDAPTAAARKAEIASRLPGALVIVDPRPGVSAARNTALAAVDARDVMAFLDDDAVIGPGWHATLSRAWSGADARTGTIGGPVRPHFLQPRPRWLSDHLLYALSIVDHGSEPREIWPEEGEHLYGANMSCSVAALREVGGFDRALGPVGDVPGFGDDIEALLRIARAGYRTLYEPEAFVWHRIAAVRLRRRAMLRRRYQDGRSRGIMDPPPTVRTALQAVAVAARAAFDYVRGDEASAMTRASYVVECAGIVRQRLTRTPPHPPDPGAGARAPARRRG